MAKRKAKKTGPAGRKRAKPAKKVKAARPKRRMRAPVMDQEAMMAAWQEAMTPGAGHRRLEPFVGSWRARTTFVMTPDAPPQVSDGTSENRWVVGGRFLEQRFAGLMMGMPFEGLGYTGYDNARGKYVGAWMDSFGTGLMHSLGVGKPTDEEIESEAESYEPSGKRVRFWCKARIQGPDHHTFEMWTKAPNGRRFRTMLIEYTRQ